MHTVHLAYNPKNGFFASAMGIMFSVNDYDKKVTQAQRDLINKFFDSLEWGTTD